MKFFYIACWVRLYHFYQFFRNFLFYYLRNPKFFLIETLSFIQYFCKSPFKILHEYDGSPYGETDFSMFEKMLDEYAISPEETILELGSGRGRVLFWLSCIRGQRKVYGIEQCEIMVSRAKRLQNYFGIENVKFTCNDWKKSVLPKTDVVYVYLAAKTDDEVIDIGTDLARLPKNTKIITIGWNLSEYMRNRYLLKAEFPIRFEWGTTTSYLQIVQ